jgi:predicted nucleic acid-binding Zn ribbon protein
VPIYTYTCVNEACVNCKKCIEMWTARMSASNNGTVECPECHTAMTRVYDPANFQFAKDDKSCSV